MPLWIPIVQRIQRSGEEPRYSVTDFDPKGPHIRGPDGGKDHSGYTESGVRAVLAERGFSEGEVQSLMHRAKDRGQPHATPTH